jgi:hypothetical protein
MAKGGASEARGIAAISALVGKQHKKAPVVKIKNIYEEKEKAAKAASRKAAAKDKAKAKEKKSKAEPKSTSTSSAESKPKSGPKAKQQELNFNPPKKKSETPRKRPAAKSASGDNPTHARDADSGKLIKLSPEHKENIKAYNDKKASYSPPKLKPVNLE